MRTANASHHVIGDTRNALVVLAGSRSISLSTTIPGWPIRPCIPTKGPSSPLTFCNELQSGSSTSAFGFEGCSSKSGTCSYSGFCYSAIRRTRASSRSEWLRVSGKPIPSMEVKPWLTEGCCSLGRSVHRVGLPKPVMRLLTEESHDCKGADPTQCFHRG